MKIHMVRKGETLLSLAEKFNVHPDALLSLNSQINNPEQLTPGMKVKIPLPPSPLELPPAEYLDEYVVRQGDTLWKLSKAWNVPLKALIAVNPQLRNPNVLLDGEIVYIPKLSAEINRVEIKIQPSTQPPVQESIQPEIPFELFEPVIEEPPPRLTQEIEQVQEDNAAMHNNVQAGGNDPSHDRIDLSLPHHAEELSHISSVASETNIDPPQWGDLYTGYMTSAAKPFDKYGIDPRMNIPSIPDDEDASTDQYQQEKPRHGNEVKLSERQSSKASANPKAKAKTGKSKTKNRVAALSVKTNHSSTKRSSKSTQKKSKPWSNV